MVCIVDIFQFTIKNICYIIVVFASSSSCVGAIKTTLSLSENLKQEYVNLIKEVSDKPYDNKLFIIGAKAEALLELPDLSYRDTMFLKILNEKKLHTAMCLIGFFSM